MKDVSVIKRLTQKKEHCIWIEIHHDFEREGIRFSLKK